MRGKRGEALIFNGSPETSRASRAVVKLTFDNSRKVFPSIDFNEVILQRDVYRDGTNEYIVNGSKVRLKDILELLGAAHIGLSGHHIISQGEADRILSANTKERRDMIEDALGLKAYQYKKEESERKLEKTRENMNQVESLRKEIAPHLRFLRKQMEKVARTEELRKKLGFEASAFFANEKEFLAQEKTRLAKELKPLKDELTKIERGIVAARDRLEKGSRVHDLTENLRKAENEREKLRGEISQVIRELGRLEGELSAFKRLAQTAGKSIPHEAAVSFFDKLIGLINELKSLAETGNSASIRAKCNVIEKEISSFRQAHQAEGKGETAVPELKTILANKEKLAERLVELKRAEETAVEEYSTVSKAVETEKEGSHLAEKEVFEFLSQEKDVQAKISDLSHRQRELDLVEDELKGNSNEVDALVGTAFLEELSRNVKGTLLSREEREIKRKDIERLKIRLEESGIAGNADIEKEYREVSERDTFLEKELADLNTSAKSLENLIAELSEKLENDFVEGLKKINIAFEEFFSILFGGGHAKLAVKNVQKMAKKVGDTEDVEDSDERNEEESESGIDIFVSLPRKKTSGLMMLSGGERALTSIALIFAMSQVNPPPFIILDETDAALDEANSKKYGDMIENLSQKSQLIVITHNRETMSRAGVIYGVTMISGGVSKVLSVAFAEAENIAK